MHIFHKHFFKKSLNKGFAILLIISVLLSYIPSDAVYATEAVDSLSFEQDMEFVSKDFACDTSEQADAAENCFKTMTEDQTAVKAEEERVDATTEIMTETENRDFSTDVMMEPENKDFTTEDISEDVITEELITEEDMPTSSSGKEIESAMDTTDLFTIQTNLETPSVVKSNSIPAGTVLCDGTFSGGYIWYVYQGNKAEQKKHYVFCIDHGSTMQNGLFSFTERSGTIETEKNTFRIAVAMDYFKSQGGFHDPAGYEDAQRTIWNIGGTTVSNQLIRYADSLFALTELNKNRSSSSESYLKLSPVSEEQVMNHSFYTGSLFGVSCKPNFGDYTVNNKTIALGGSAWSYFAGGANGMGDIQVAGCYDINGNSLGQDAIKTSLTAKGKLNVSFQTTDNYGTAEKPITILLKVRHTYSGCTSLNYLDCGSGKQRMAYDCEFHSPAYFALQVYTGNPAPGTSVRVSKVDGLGNPVSGARFQLSMYNTFDDGAEIQYMQEGYTDAEGIVEFTGISQEATGYTITELEPAPGMLFHRAAPDSQQTKALIGQFDTVLRNGTLCVEHVICFDSDYIFSDSGGSFTFYVPNDYAYGSVQLHKDGNFYLGEKENEPYYKEKPLYNVAFSLYTAEDIYLGDTLLFPADTKLTQEVLDASVWCSLLQHKVTIEERTDREGDLHATNLPLGKYYFIETDNPYNIAGQGFFLSGMRIPFTITAGTEAEVVALKFPNNEIRASCVVKKIEAAEDSENTEMDKPLSGAEFTLYAHITNVNSHGTILYQAEQTEPAVIYRDKNGNEKVEEHTWIPIETAISNENGIAEFTNQLPYGTYLVVETQPPVGYSLAVGDSYRFVHEFDNNTDYGNGKVFTHTFEDFKKGGRIRVLKSGELLQKAVTKASPYGPYKELQFGSGCVKGVTFGIYDCGDNLIETLITDENGVAESNLLPAGTYMVKELDNQGVLRLDTTPKKVILTENTSYFVSSETVSFDNAALCTRLQLYKTVETYEKNPDAPTNSSEGNTIYRYDTKPQAGIVFGIFARKAITNKKGTIFVKKDACLGYFVTDEDGLAVFEGKLVEGDYYCKEIRSVSPFYQLDETEYDFSIAYNGTDCNFMLNQPSSPIVNHLYKGAISVVKQDGETQTPLAGVAFLLYDKDKNQLASFVTNDKGEIRIDNLPLGTYYLQETQTLEEYILDDTLYQIDLTVSNQTVHLELKNYKEQVKGAIIGSADTSDQEQIKGYMHAKTGDDWKLKWIVGIGIISILAFCILCLKIYTSKNKTKHVNGEKKRIWMRYAMFSTYIIGMVFFCKDFAHAQAIGSVFYQGTSGSGYVLYENCLYTFIHPDGSTWSYKEAFDEDGRYDSSGTVPVGLALAATLEEKTITLPKEITFHCKNDYTISGEYTDNQTWVEARNLPLYSYLNQNTSILEEPASVEEGEITLPVVGIYAGASGFYQKESESNALLQTSKATVLLPEEITYSSALFLIKGNPYSSQDCYKNLTILLKNRQLDQTLKYLCPTGITTKMGMDSISFLDNNWEVFLKQEIYQKNRNILESLSKHLFVYYNMNLGTIMRTVYTDFSNYHMGSISYHLYGGSMNGSFVSEYPMYGSCGVSNPTRKDYAFCGWYTDADYAKESRLSEENQLFYLTDALTAKNQIELYAKWEYSVDVTRDFVQYHIYNNHTATVTRIVSGTEVEVKDTISYNGKTYPVVGVEEQAGKGATIHSLTLPHNIKSIGDTAFTDCKLCKLYVYGEDVSIKNCIPADTIVYTYANSVAAKEYEETADYSLNLFASKLFYVLNGGTNSLENPDKYNWNTYLQLASPQKEHCRFDGWFLDAAFQENSRITYISREICKDMVLYAKFTPYESETTASDSEEDEEVVWKNQENTTEYIAPAATMTTPIPVAEKNPEISSQVISFYVKAFAKKGKKIRLQLQSDAAVEYEICYSTSKKFRTKKTKTIVTDKDQYTIKHLKKGKTYYIKVRAKWEIGENNSIWSDWCTLEKGIKIYR